mmetsp:Transcript_2836/g.11437  ORF Transcript_2836/g.11437 Transcript_2836/m.11437 type:complete len:280 (+) Transcript_2836:1384-2223(+)
MDTRPSRSTMVVLGRLSAGASSAPWFIFSGSTPTLRAAATGSSRTTSTTLGPARLLITASIASMAGSSGTSTTAFCSSSLRWSTAGRIPHSRAMKRAVRMLSPVHMRTRIPALRQLATARGTSGRTGSLMPTMPTSTRPSSRRSMALWYAASRSSPEASLAHGSSSSASPRTQTASARSPVSARRAMERRMRSWPASSRAAAAPVEASSWEHRSASVSAAPLTSTTAAASSATASVAAMVSVVDPPVPAALASATADAASNSAMEPMATALAARHASPE